MLRCVNVELSSNLTLRDRVLSWLERQVPPKRVRHILGVEATAADLARYHGLDAGKAQLAGLTHDLAKCFDPRAILEMVRAEGIAIDAEAAARPQLLHAEAGAIVARDEFGIRDPQVLAAIANHTLGRPEMDPISCVVLLADKLEPNRGDTPELNDLRAASFANLYRGVRQTCDYSLKYLVKTSRPIHPRAVATRNWALACETATPRAAVK